MSSHDHDGESTVGSHSVVAYPDVTSSGKARTIGRLKLALEFVSLGFLVMTVLFVWQVTKKSDASVQASWANGFKSRFFTPKCA